VAIGNTYNTTEENLLEGILVGLGGSIANIGNDQVNTKNDLLKAILQQVEFNNSGGGTGVAQILPPTPEVGIYASYHTHQFSPKGKSNYLIDSDINSNKNDFIFGALKFSNNNPKISVSFTEKNAAFLNYNPVIEIGYIRNAKNGNTKTQHPNAPVKRFVHPPNSINLTHQGNKYRHGVLDWYASKIKSQWQCTIAEEYNKQIVEIDMNGFVEGYGANFFYGKPNKINFPFFGKKQKTKNKNDSLCFIGRNFSGRLIVAFRFRIDNPIGTGGYITSDWSKSIVIDICYEKAKLTGTIPINNEGVIIAGTFLQSNLNYIATGWRARLLDIVT
jgi:hypothetical protein